MPIYEYECESCGHRLEAIQRMSDAALTECPTCGKSTLKKLISAAGFQLKGSGWYATDFKGSGKPAEKTKGKDGDPAAKPADTSQSKSEPGSDSGSAKTETASASSGGCGGNCSCH